MGRGKITKVVKLKEGRKEKEGKGINGRILKKEGWKKGKIEKYIVGKINRNAAEISSRMK